MICLGIESSCDETALAIVRDGKLVDSVIATQMELHALFGGVVPELASREHYRFIGPLFDTLMRRSCITPADIDVYAVSRGPGLLGALLVGVCFAKGLAFASRKPVLGINHLHAHLLATGLEQPLRFPALGVLVSGGHTHLYRIEDPATFKVLGKTLDDAAGEAFDKVGKILGLPYPGGRLLDALAQRGQADKKLFPRPYTDNDNLDFSFSGLKTAAATHIAKHPYLKGQGADAENAPQELCDLCASFNEAVVDTLVIKTTRALKKQKDIRCIILAGGVAANSLLRQRMATLMEEYGGDMLSPSPQLCTDNAAMVAYTAYLLSLFGLSHALSFEAVPRGRAIPEDMLRSHCA